MDPYPTWDVGHSPAFCYVCNGSFVRYVRVEGERDTVRVECLARECNTRPAMAKASPTCVRVNVD